MRALMDEFIKYAKEQFGYGIIPEISSNPDTFESLFGVSFIKQEDENLFFSECKEKNAVYKNVSTKVNYVGIHFNETVSLLEDISLAA